MFDQQKTKFLFKLKTTTNKEFNLKLMTQNFLYFSCFCLNNLMTRIENNKKKRKSSKRKQRRVKKYFIEEEFQRSFIK